MSTVSNILLDNEILLESGTNELEILVFEVADYLFGINVAKVREILPAGRITSLPKAHRAIRGVFKLRNHVIPCVSLIEHLGIESTRADSEATMILTDFNQQQTAFLVDQVERIHRLSWENILAVPPVLAMANTPVTAMARCGDRLVVMLDFEMIIDQVTDRFFRQDAVENPQDVPRETAKLILADDSITVREAVSGTLRASGYTNLQIFENGAEAWRYFERRLAETDRLEEIGDLMISDVEMPQIDGLHLTKRIKEHPVLRDLPVLLYSSIVTPDNHKKGLAVGADAQVSKPELSRVVEYADALILQARERRNGGAGEAVSAPAPTPVAQAARPVPPVPVPTPAVTSPPASAAHRAAANPQLWQTFLVELKGRAASLLDIMRQVDGQGPSAELVNSIYRLLHTIKSAAMVVPIDEVTRTTHLVESLFESARRDPQQWPSEAMAKYAAWLSELSDPDFNRHDVLARSAALESALAAELGSS